MKKQPEYSLCSSVGQPPCSLCAQKPLFAGMLVPGSVVKLKIIWEQIGVQNVHLEGVVAFFDCIPSFLLSSCVCFSTPLLITDAVATIAEMNLNANLCLVNFGSIYLVCRPPVLIICCSVLPRLLLLLTPIPLTARIVMRIAGHPASQAFFPINFVTYACVLSAPDFPL